MKYFRQISVVIPIFNEAENISLLIKSIDEALLGLNYEIIIVNDGSTDDTRTRLKEIYHSSLFIIELEKNYGQSLALEAGIDLAIGKYIVTMDGDLQNDPFDIPWMIDKAELENWDLVTGIRNNRKDSFIKTIPSKIANYIISIITKLDIKDHGCALKVFTKETAKRINLQVQMHRYITLLAHFNGAKIVQVPVRHNQRQFGSSNYGLERVFRVTFDLLKLVYFQYLFQKNKNPLWIKEKKYSYKIKEISLQN